MKDDAQRKAKEACAHGYIVAICWAMLPEYELIHAIEGNCIEGLDAAIRRGATLDSCDINGRCVLEVAMRRGLLDMGRRLVRMGANSNRSIGRQGDRLVHMAARTGNMGFLQLLLEAGVDANTKGNCQRTPLHHIAKGEHQYMAELLFEHGANLNAIDDRGSTPLHYAGTKGNLLMVRLLLRHNANATITNNQLYTPMHNAAAEGHTEAVQVMVSHERLLNPRFATTDILRRIRCVAELHGRVETARVIAVAETEVKSMTVSFDHPSPG